MTGDTISSQTPPENLKIQSLVILTKHLEEEEEVGAIPLMHVTQYDWHQIHDTWLNDAMKSKLGITEGIGWLYFSNISTTPRPQQNRKIHPMPMRAVRVQYDVQLKVQESTDPVEQMRSTALQP